MLRDDSGGFAAAGAAYVSFSGAVEPASLDGAVLAVDLDSAAGTRTPLQLRYSDAPTLFLPAHTLAALPLYGFPFAAGHRHALLVTTAARDSAGKPIAPAEAMRRALGLSQAGLADADAVRVTAPLVAWAKKAGFDLGSVALASVFSVHDAAAPILGLA